MKPDMDMFVFSDMFVFCIGQWFLNFSFKKENFSLKKKKKKSNKLTPKA